MVKGQVGELEEMEGTVTGRVEGGGVDCYLCKEVAESGDNGCLRLAMPTSLQLPPSSNYPLIYSS